MAAKWSNVWDNKNIPTRLKKAALDGLRFTPPAAPKKRTGGKYPHLQPFFRNRQKVEAAVSRLKAAA